jgi:hypothetical protein
MVINIDNHTETTYASSGRTINTNSFVNRNGETSRTLTTVTETIISSDRNSYVFTGENTPISPTGLVKRIDAEFEVYELPDGSVTVTFQQFDLREGGSLKYTLDTNGNDSTYELTLMGSDTIAEILTLNFLYIENGNREINITHQGSTLFNQQTNMNPMAALNSNFNLRDFSVFVIVGAGIGGLKGATKNPTWAGVGMGALEGALIAGMAYSAKCSLGQLFSVIFSGSCSSETAVAGMTSSAGQTSTNIPTLSEWKQIFLTLFIIASGIAFLRYRQYVPVHGSKGNSYTRASWGSALFEGVVLKNVPAWCLISIIISTILILFIYRELTFLDAVGIIVCSPLLAYILNAIYIECQQSKH